MAASQTSCIPHLLPARSRERRQNGACRCGPSRAWMSHAPSRGRSRFPQNHSRQKLETKPSASPAFPQAVGNRCSAPTLEGGSTIEKMIPTLEERTRRPCATEASRAPSFRANCYGSVSLRSHEPYKSLSPVTPPLPLRPFARANRLRRTSETGASAPEMRDCRDARCSTST